MFQKMIIGSKTRINTGYVRFQMLFLITMFVFVSVSLVAETQDVKVDHIGEETANRITFTAENMPISEVLREFAIQSGANIVVTTEPATTGEDQARVTVKIEDLTVVEALKKVLDLAGLSHRYVGDNTFLVGSANRLVGTRIVREFDPDDVGHKSISFVAENMPISEVLREFAIQSGANIVVSNLPATTGEDQARVTVDLTNIPLEMALDMSVRATGLDFIRSDENTYFVGCKDMLADVKEARHHERCQDSDCEVCDKLIEQKEE